MNKEMTVLNEQEMEAVSGGGYWTGIGNLWQGGGDAFAVVAGVGIAFGAAPAIVAVAIIAGGAFAASGAMIHLYQKN